MQEPLPPHEFQRLQVLARYAGLETLPEQALDRLTRLAARLFGVPIALVSLAGEEHHWFKACFGLNIRGLPRSQSLCVHTIEQGGVMVVPDAREDVRFAGNLLVTGPAQIRFYAGTPLVAPGGSSLGTLCVMDDRPRPGFTDEERTMLVDLAALAMDELEWRLDRRQLETASRARAQLLADLHRARQKSRILVALADLAEQDLELAEYVGAVGELLRPDVGVQWVQVHALDHPSSETWTGPEASPGFLRLMGGKSAPPHRGAHCSGPGLRAPLFAHSAQENPAQGTPALHPTFAALGVSSAAWLPFTTTNERRFVLAFARFGDRGPWRPGDRTLLQAAARTLNLALSRQEHRDCLRSLARTARVDITEPFLPAELDLHGFRAGARTKQDTNDEVGLTLFGEAFRTGPVGKGTASPLGEGRLALVLGGAAPARQQGEWGAGDVNRAVAVTRAAASGPMLANPGVALARTWREEHPAQEGVGVLEGAATTPEPMLSYGPLLLHRDERVVRVGERTVRLSRQETTLLASLMDQPEVIFSREALAHAASSRVVDASNLVNVHISHLRRKLKCLTSAVVIRTVRGEGYALSGAVGSAGLLSIRRAV